MLVSPSRCRAGHQETAAAPAARRPLTGCPPRHLALILISLRLGFSVQYRNLGKSDLNVSVISLGTMSWPGANYGDSAAIRRYPEDPRGHPRNGPTAFDSGINLSILAEGCGRGLAEEMLGRTLQELGCREKAVIVTKVGSALWRRTDWRKNLQSFRKTHAPIAAPLASKRLRTDYVDLYLAAWPDPRTPNRGDHGSGGQAWRRQDPLVRRLAIFPTICWAPLCGGDRRFQSASLQSGGIEPSTRTSARSASRTRWESWRIRHSARGLERKV